MVLKSVNETKAVSESRMLFKGSIKTKVAKEAKATDNRLASHSKHMTSYYGTIQIFSNQWRGWLGGIGQIIIL